MSFKQSSFPKNLQKLDKSDRLLSPLSINENYYEYDKAGRLVAKVEKRDGFRKQETDYRWNGKNELVGITTPKGEVWHYKYDALGRRISKECPQQHLRIEYLWDGDQIAFTRTFKNDEIVSERHSIFNDFELIAQQDHYQQLKQTIDGNFIEWKQETGYAICQPNGQVLALLNPQGKTLWRREKQTLWGLCFANEYRQSNPLDPQMLFAGQWLDEESRLAYNRFRYYDPETGNYISSDPIGLQGGETPYGYVHNPLSFIDLFGLSSCWNKKSRIKEALLPTKGKIRYIPPKGWQPSMPLPKKDGGYLDNFGNIGKKGPSRTAGEAFEWDVQLSKAGKDSIGWLTRDGSHANISLIGRVTHK